MDVRSWVLVLEVDATWMLKRKSRRWKGVEMGMVLSSTGRPGLRLARTVPFL